MSCSQDDLQRWILLSLTKGGEMQTYLSKAILNKGCPRSTWTRLL